MHWFQFKGGSVAVDQKQIKFHAYVTDEKGNEKHLYEAARMGLVDRELATHPPFHTPIYRSSLTVLKVFTSTKGFGIPSEYFSYFFFLSNTSTKVVTIKPLGAKYLDKDFRFNARGRFLSSNEIGRIYGQKSPTYKYFLRQSMISKRRLLEMVTVEEVDSSGEITQTPQVRKLRV